ncbi:RHS repeat domain-containing protein [Pinirhizobacter soli]|uniref:RHS repeat domain-containing protein n=1 Tax=Pinirhizobacter soli TaxID=2786953 RepID=UPI002029CEB2|nr:RHS repeat-associated core domain-containing protein [Pinirhizobacter soli]
MSTTRTARTKILALVGVISMALVAPAKAGETVNYYYTDPLESIIATTSANSAIVSVADYRPYGQQTLGSSEPGPGYDGHVNDLESGLIYMQARYYDANMARFISADPKNPAPGSLVNFSRYAYAANNPIANVDPTGKEPLPILDGMRDFSNFFPDAQRNFAQKLAERSSAEATVTAAAGSGVTVTRSLYHAENTAGIVLVGEGLELAADGKFRLMTFQLPNSAESPVRISSSASFHFLLGGKLSLEVDPGGKATIYIGGGLGLGESYSYITVSGVIKKNETNEKSGSDGKSESIMRYESWEISEQAQHGLPRHSPEQEPDTPKAYNF